MNTRTYKKQRSRLLLMICQLLFISTQTMSAQSARSILDKAAATVSNPGGVQANFQLVTREMGTTNGQIAVKGNKFHATTSNAMIWFDGKTQWTYLKSNEEVNISNPTEEQLQAINPYNFINLYKKGFRLSSKTMGNFYEVHLTPTSKRRKIQEMYIIVDKNTYHPTHIKMRQNNSWGIILISQLRSANLSDALFQFQSKDFPRAEVIDLR